MPVVPQPLSAVLLTTPENFTYYDVMLVQLFKDMNCDIGGGGAVRESLAEYVASGSSSRKLGYFFLDVACKFNASWQRHVFRTKATGSCAQQLISKLLGLTLLGWLPAGRTAVMRT